MYHLLHPLVAPLLLPLLLHVSLITAQTAVPPNEVISLPITLPPPGDVPFQNETFQLSITPPTTLLAELYIPSSPPHSGSRAPLLLASASSPPAAPGISDPCSQSQPCPPEPFDAVAFYTRADTASIRVPTDAATAFVTVYNWNVPQLPDTPLSGTLFLRAVARGTADCPMVARGAVCRGRGACPTGERVCRCQAGWSGASCGTRLAEAPATSERPRWDGAVAAMRQSAVVSVPGDGVTYVWRIGGGDARVEFRARVLRGDVVVDGSRKTVDGGGGKFSMVVKRAYENLGEGLEEGTRLPTIYDEAGVGKVVVKSGGVYEVVVVGEGVGNWVMALVADGGDAVVSVSARRCGESGLLDCAFASGEEGIPVGVAAAVGVVAVVLLMVVVVLCMCFVRRGRRKQRSTPSGAWTDVDFSKIDAMQEEGRDAIK